MLETMKRLVHAEKCWLRSVDIGMEKGLPGPHYTHGLSGPGHKIVDLCIQRATEEAWKLRGPEPEGSL